MNRIRVTYNSQKLRIILLDIAQYPPWDKWTLNFLSFPSLGSPFTLQAIPTHGVAAGMSELEGVVMEIVITFALVYTVYATAADPKKGSLGTIAPIAIGFIVGANILAAGPFSGGSMNPARSFGPAVASGNFAGNWVYWVGPLIGGGLAGLVYGDIFIGSYAPLPATEDYA